MILSLPLPSPSFQQWLLQVSQSASVPSGKVIFEEVLFRWTADGDVDLNPSASGFIGAQFCSECVRSSKIPFTFVYVRSYNSNLSSAT